MKIAMKFMLAFLACGAVTIAVYTQLQARAELAFHEANMAQEHALMARVLRPPILRLWEREGEGRALERIEAARRDVLPVELRWVWLDESPPGLSPEQVAALREGREVHWVERAPPKAPRSYTYVPLTPPSGRIGALVLSESLVNEARIVRSALVDDVIATAVVALLASFVALALGAWLVARPMAAIVDQTQRLGQGDFSARLDVRSKDEFGILASAINSMADQLHVARENEHREAEAKLRAVEQLRHADRLTTVGKLASGLAHELGTPLNVISMRTKMLLAGEVPEDEHTAYLESISGQTDRLTRIVRQLLDFARRKTPTRERTNLLAIARKTASFLQPLARNANVNLIVEDGPDVVANVDGGQIEQVLTNLTVNAIQASPSGGTVSISVREEPEARAPVDVGGGTRAAAALRVDDEGPGLSEELRSRIFEPFFTTKGPGEGTGLGLSVAYGIVQDHKGWIDVSSREHKGSSFQVFLPKELG